MGSASMAGQDQTGSPGSNSSCTASRQASLYLDVHSVKNMLLNDRFCTGDDFAPKVRKPYTITKQRERWTEEEHKKFLDAVELYGRAWKRIEAHVGTKTAIQIRSHAQKFFSKVERESRDEDLGTGKRIEIPPPRPKRKPLHPYPREVLRTVKSAATAPYKSTSSLSPPGEAHQSPTSVLSASCLRTPAAMTDSNSPGISHLADSSDECADSVTQVISKLPKESSKLETYPSEKANNRQDKNDQEPAVHELELFGRDNSLVKQGSMEVSSTQRFKLFGKTVLVTDSCRPSSPIGAGKMQPWDLVDGQSSSTSLAVPTPVRHNIADIDCSLGAMACWALTPLCTLLPQGEGLSRDHLQSLSRQADHGGPPSPPVKVHCPVPMKAQLLSDNKQVQTTSRGEISTSSSTEFDSVSCNRLAGGKKSISKLSMTAFLENRGAESFKCGKGFEPYKRCTAEQDGQWAITVEERELQRVRLCL